MLVRRQLGRINKCRASAGTDALRNLNGKGLYAQAKITDTHKARIRPLSSREHNMRRVLRGLVLRHRKSQRGQVKTGKQCLTLTEGSGCKSNVEGID
jgi:hypothetical protein